MTQIALLALAVTAVAALAAAGLLARGRSRALARAGAAETAAAHGEERARAADARLARGEQQLRDAQAVTRRVTEETKRAETRALAAEGRVREADQRTAAAEHRAAEAELHARAAEDRTAEAVRLRAAAEERTAALLAEIGHLAEERVATAALRLSHPNAPAAGPLDAEAVGPEAVRLLQAVLDASAAAVTEERERVDAAARAAMRGATSKIQTLLYQIQSLVQQLQNDNDDPRLLEVDFRNEVALRRIQTIAVLCEAWPGLARTDSPLAEVVVGALSRVPGYARVKVANHLRENRLAVVARAAEPLAITIAELLANATSYSHPETDVPVTVQQGGRGALVIVDDSGIGMEEDQLGRARRLLAGPSEVLLTELGNPPKTGFAVVGKLARQYGFACHIEPSPYGGMRTIVRIPAALLTVVDGAQPLSVLTPLPLRAGSGPAPTVQALPARRGRSDEPGGQEVPDREQAPAMHVVPPVHAVADDGSGLPSRRRRQPLAHRPQPADGAAAADSATGSVPRVPAADDPAEADARTPEQAAARWQALQQGTGSGRAAVAAAAAADEAAALGGATADPVPAALPVADPAPVPTVVPATDPLPAADPAPVAGTAPATDPAPVAGTAPAPTTTQPLTARTSTDARAADHGDPDGGGADHTGPAAARTGRTGHRPAPSPEGAEQ
ncbi:ATP-binding protein [Kitasatospora sp. A2-31]|uniref:ATP-binding protein n=1 Tax=Kitasatospora sp. A2-31 TaxID=2916414 RepID=UPI001EE9BD00|nr:ATP-binding protein [Kitasatospora sp. A2-31]MCG6497393.1 sensor histidine kinase [Kitasatospora sp. A2-31]MCG6500151.1 sensor histidine kinase [Kitasatospora sp. A2-31]